MDEQIASNNKLTLINQISNYSWFGISFNIFSGDPFEENRNAYWKYLGSLSGEKGSNPSNGSSGNNGGGRNSGWASAGYENATVYHTGWYSGIKNYLEERTDQKIREGHIAAATIDQVGIEAIDLLLPQSGYEIPLMFLGNIRVFGKSWRLVSVGEKGLTKIASKMHLKNLSYKVVHSRDATEKGFRALTVNMYHGDKYVGTMHQVINPRTNKVLHRDFKRLIYNGVDYRR